MGTPVIIFSAPHPLPPHRCYHCFSLFPSISFHISSVSIPLSSFLVFPLWPSLYLPPSFRGFQVLSQVRGMRGREFGYREVKDSITTGLLRKWCTTRTKTTIRTQSISTSLHSICDNIYKTLFLKENTVFMLITHYSKPTKILLFVFILWIYQPVLAGASCGFTEPVSHILFRQLKEGWTCFERSWIMVWLVYISQTETRGMCLC